MSQPISVSVQMDAASFHDFATFDLLRHRKAWHRPLAFTAILLASAGVCLSQVGQKDGAALLTVVLSVVALGVPAVYFWTFFHSLRLQIKKMGLPRPFYRLTLDDAGLSVWMAGEQDKPEPTRSYPWHDLTIEKGSILEKIYGKTEIRINSFHHQAVKDPGKDIEIIAKSADGVPEAIVQKNHPFSVAVQWHPEMMYDSDEQLKLLKAFVDACR